MQNCRIMLGLIKKQFETIIKKACWYDKKITITLHTKRHFLLSIVSVFLPLYNEMNFTIYLYSHLAFLLLTLTPTIYLEYRVIKRLNRESYIVLWVHNAMVIYKSMYLQLFFSYVLIKIRSWWENIRTLL